MPARGTQPTTGWGKGEVIVDEYQLAVEPDAPGGDCIVEIGIYKEDVGRRLSVFNKGGRPWGIAFCWGR